MLSHRIHKKHRLPNNSGGFDSFEEKADWRNQFRVSALHAPLNHKLSADSSPTMSTPPLDQSNPPSPSPKTAYAFLTAHLDSHVSQILEIEILPSSIPLPANPSPPFLIDNLSLGLPKKTLVEVFLTARQLFHSPNTTTTERQQATRAILLFDPEHLTAANIRKRRLLDLRSGSGDGCTGGAEQLLQALRQELAFLSSLLTSPLNRHTKSPTLWYHRDWVLRTFLPHIINPGAETGREEIIEGSHAGTAGGIRSLWLSELAIIMLAGDRHPRNYYAWNYARRLFRFLSYRISSEAAIDPTLLTTETTEQVQKWCFQHPRDISGWTFLAFLFEQHTLCQGLSAEENESVRGLKESVVADTEEWIGSFAWEGESVEWFLRTMKKDAGGGGKAKGVG